MALEDIPEIENRETVQTPKPEDRKVEDVLKSIMESKQDEVKILAALFNLIHDMRTKLASVASPPETQK